ncbi:MAG TPA: glycosyltransferase family 2 protein [Steroidobacteraceae bacterium]|nr:glycosyltransferase family 2 protein [Steroidobacteraceae bacterium]
MKSQAPQVSIVLPTYNRRRTLLRAVHSVIAQTFQDWELIVVDDGSTDGSADLLDGLDPRVQCLRRANAGAAAARNAGLAVAAGRYLSFLDSDDEWLPHFLALTVGFLERHPDQGYVSTESFDMKPDGRCVRQDVDALDGHYVWLARRLQSHDLDLPEGSTDPYLRVYQRCQPLGEWAHAHAPEQLREEPWLRWYQGDIAEKYRWGYFHALWCIVARRELVAAAGPFAEGRRSCNDLEFLIELARRAPSNMIAVPSVRKNLVAADAGAAQLSRGRSYADFTRNFAQVIHQCFLSRDPHNAELQRIYAFRRLEAAKAALSNGLRTEAREHLRVAGATLNWPSLWILRAMAWCAPTDTLARAGYALYNQLESRFPALV